MQSDLSLFKEYFPELSGEQLNQFNQLQDLYSYWNDKINVISRKDIDNLYVNHILHSLGITKIVSFKANIDILDVGTGGGFPGIPLAIFFPQTQFHLVDSIGKKIKVVDEVSRALGLRNVKAEHMRAEDVNGKYDFVISRAVTRMKEFYGWVRNKIKKENQHDRANGILYLKGGDLDEEMAELGKPHQIFNLKDYFKEEFFETKKVVYVPSIQNSYE
jgi:16S rRNA (guanine527-N7)-methyltransferase